MPKAITPNLWFDTQAEEAAQYYCSIFPDSRIVEVLPTPGPDTVLTVDFELQGKRFTGINGGPEFKFTEAVSFLVECADQAELDHYWERLTDGGEEGSCGWCKDRYGLSWQVIPAGMIELFRDDDPERARRALEAMYGMRKLDIAAVRAAAEGSRGGLEAPGLAGRGLGGLELAIDDRQSEVPEARVREVDADDLPELLGEREPPASSSSR